MVWPRYGLCSPGRAVHVWPRRYPCGMGKRTSIYLSDDQAAAVKASGLRLGELLNRGLERSSELEDTLRRVLREELGQSRPAAYSPEPQHGRTPELMPQLEHEPSPEPARKPARSAASACPPPKARVLKGLCGNCGTYVG